MRLGWVILVSLACFAASFYLFINVGTSAGRSGGVITLLAGVILLIICGMGHSASRAARRKRDGNPGSHQPF